MYMCFRGLYPRAWLTLQNTGSIQGSKILNAFILFGEKQCSGSNLKVCYSNIHLDIISTRLTKPSIKFTFSIRPKKLINSFSGTAASLKSSPHQPFLFIVFPYFSYLIIFGFPFYRNNNKRLSDSEYILHQRQSNVCISRDIVMSMLPAQIVNGRYIIQRYSQNTWKDLKFGFFYSPWKFIWVCFQLVQFALLMGWS